MSRYRLRASCARTVQNPAASSAQHVATFPRAAAPTMATTTWSERMIILRTEVLAGALPSSFMSTTTLGGVAAPRW
ncbi:hypothetical protein PR202_ga23625 [Eleusine coracana subsp. coracana]|uniref:Uncharacterized protein n=1 Tax=Eleusine coracana subsp. coracana TaxID=191504 RepID=A0AAV5D6T2_ELECO|nr:hypothetical protein PR202_ga23625 [Eleusine coracana subsp. coracana]